MSSFSLVESQGIRQMEAGALPTRNDRRKANLVQITVPQYFGGFFSHLKD